MKLPILEQTTLLAAVILDANDFYFPASGAEAYKRDLKDVDYNIFNTGHFALEEDGALIADKIRGFFAARDIK
jgi:pimeloyl-ACP methyl ester carboxylesterase